MKFFILALALAAAVAEPEADADAFLPYVRSGIYGLPRYTTGIRSFSPYTRSYVTPSYFGTGYYNGYYKRDADADADADPLYLRSAYYGNPIFGGYTGYNTGYTGYSPRGIYNPFVRNVYSGYYKRDADADADPLLLRSAYSTGFYGHPTGITGYTGYTPFRSAYNFNPFYRNVYSGYYKRDADADADPNLVYQRGTYHTNLANVYKQGVAHLPGNIYKSYTPYMGYGFPGHFGGYYY